MAAKRGLGKGLDSLIVPKTTAAGTNVTADAVVKRADAEEVIFVPIGEVEPNRSQPRKHFEEESLQELADSIKQHGILQPLLVRRQDDYYEIIAGERRWRAAKMAKLKKIPVMVKEVTDRERSEIALIENLQREDLDPIEEAMAYRRLIEEYRLKQDEVAQRVSKSRSAITNSMRLLKLDERVQQMLQEQQISMGHARALLALPKEDAQYETAQQIVSKGLSVRETEKLVQKKKEAKAPEAPQKEPDREAQQKAAVYRKLEQKLSESLGAKVGIRDADGKGKIEIYYYSAEELERLLELLQ